MTAAGGEKGRHSAAILQICSMIDWEGWRCVLLVARHGTVAAAASVLGVDPTTAARRLRRLEQALGLRLFERHGTRLRPTAACLGLVPRIEAAETALVGAESAFERGAGTVTRSLRVTAVAFLVDRLLAPALPDLLARLRMRVELLADDRNLSLSRREADIAVRLGPPEQMHGAVGRLGLLPFAVYAARGTEASRLPWAGLDDRLAHLPESRWTARAAGPRGIEHKANRFATLAEMAAAGVVRVLLPTIVGEADQRLVEVGDRGAVHREVWFIGHPEDAEAAHIRTAVVWIADRFAGLVA